MTNNSVRTRPKWRFIVIVGAALMGFFVLGLFAGTVSPFNALFSTGISSNAGTPIVQPVSRSFVVNQTITVSGNSIVFGNVSTVGYRTVTMFIHMEQTSCALGSLYFNGYWKPDRNFPGIAASGLTSIIFQSTPGSVAAVAPVAGGQLYLYLVPTTTGCSISGLWVSVYLQP